MASLWVMTIPPSEVEYSFVTGRVRAFTMLGEILFDEAAGIESAGWKEQLALFVKRQRLDVDRDDSGVHAFIPWMEEQGLL